MSSQVLAAFLTSSVLRFPTVSISKTGGRSPSSKCTCFKKYSACCLADIPGEKK